MNLPVELDKPMYPLAEVAAMFGFPLQVLKTGCSQRRYEHIFVGREFFMTPDQIRDLVRKCTRPAVASRRPAGDADARNHRRAARALRGVV